MHKVARADSVAGGRGLLTASTAWAQPSPGRIRGQIEKADGGMLSVKTRDGAMLNVKLADDARVSALVKAWLSDIKDESVNRVARLPLPDGSIKAFSVHVF